MQWNVLLLKVLLRKWYYKYYSVRMILINDNSIEISIVCVLFIIIIIIIKYLLVKYYIINLREIQKCNDIISKCVINIINVSNG